MDVYNLWLLSVYYRKLYYILICLSLKVIELKNGHYVSIQGAHLFTLLQIECNRGDASVVSAKRKAGQPAWTGSVLWWLQLQMPDFFSPTVSWTDLRFTQMSVSSFLQWTHAATCLASTEVCVWDMARTATSVTALALATSEKTAPSVSPWMCLSYPLGVYCFWRNLKYSFCS